ncbi:unnamed protein product [Durusdinium trenchii]
MPRVARLLVAFGVCSVDAGTPAEPPGTRRAHRVERDAVRAAARIWVTARSGAERDFVLMEAGSSIGFWSLKAAKAFRNATASLVDGLIQEYGQIDMLHMDIQGGELELLKESKHLLNVLNVHIGTHGFHDELREEFLRHGFALDFDFIPHRFVRTAYGPVYFVDGILAGHQQSNWSEGVRKSMEAS